MNHLNIIAEVLAGHGFKTTVLDEAVQVGLDSRSVRTSEVALVIYQEEMDSLVALKLSNDSRSVLASPIY